MKLNKKVLTIIILISLFNLYFGLSIKRENDSKSLAKSEKKTLNKKNESVQAQNQVTGTENTTPQANTNANPTEVQNAIPNTTPTCGDREWYNIQKGSCVAILGDYES